MATQVLVFTGSTSSARGTAVPVEENMIDVDELRRNLETFLQSAEQVVTQSVMKRANLTDYTIQVGISAKGKVGFLGTGGELGASASLTLKYTVPRAPGTP
jgi:hypothetical protein